MDAQECDVLVSGFFRDERPLKGSSGWIDWRLNGRLSQLLIERKLTGDWKEATLIPSQERILPRMILLIGLGEVKEYGYVLLRKLAPHLLDTLRKLGPLSACLSFPFGETYRVDCRRIVESLILGIGEGLQQLRNSDEEGWGRRLRLYFAEGEEYFQEILSGIQTAKPMLGGGIQMEVFTSSEGPYTQSTRMKT